MTRRGWKYRSYADEQPTPVADFFCGFVGGTITLYSFPGWLLPYFGWLSMTATMLLCAGAGLLLGIWMAREAVKESKLTIQRD